MYFSILELTLCFLLSCLEPKYPCLSFELFSVYFVPNLMPMGGRKYSYVMHTLLCCEKLSWK